MAKKYYWLKLKEDFFRDKRIKKLRSVAGGDTYTLIYLKMQLLSLQNDGILIFEGVEDTFAKELALDIDEDVTNIEFLLQFLFGSGMLEETEANHFVLTETIKCIGTESASAERVRKHREQKALQSPKSEKALQCNTSVTNCNIEKEKELEKREKSKSKEKEEDLEEEQKKKRFKRPTLEEVKAYCLERNNTIDAEYFYDYYESNGWKVNKNSMKDWKATIRNWERNQKSNNKGKEDKKEKDEYERMSDWFSNRKVEVKEYSEDEINF